MARYKAPWEREVFPNPYSYSLGNPSSTFVNGLVDWYTRQQEEEEQKYVQPDQNRSFLDRTLDVLSAPVYVGAGAIKGMIDGESSTSGWSGAWEGLKASNPFGDGFEKGEVTYSDVLGEAGWNPESGLGKFTKGTVGFVGDVLLDPTTYLTGGASALIKGTGRVGKTAENFTKVVDDVAKTRYSDELVRQQLEKYNGRKLAVSNEMVNNAKDAENLIRNTSQKGMSEEMARAIVEKQTAERGITRSADEITDSARKLSDEYNRVMGFRDVKGAGDVTFGIGNLPFAPKKWERYNIKLGSQATLQRASDSLGISKAYAGLRNYIYGSQIGKMFSTTSPLWKLSQDDPAKLWEALEFVEHTRGLKMDKLQAEKEITERFKSFNLSPAENKEVLQLLQDKTVWNKIVSKAKVTDLAKFQEVKSAVTSSINESKKVLEDLTSQKETMEIYEKSLTDGLTTEKSFLDALKGEREEKLFNLKTSYLNDMESVESGIQMYADEIAELDGRINSSTKKVAQLENELTNSKRNFEEADRVEREKVAKKVQELESLRRMADFESSKRDAQLKQREKMQGNKLSARDKTNSPESSEVYDELAKGVNKAVDEEVFRMGVETQSSSNLFALKEELSKFIYGKEGHFVSTNGTSINKLFNKMSEGATIDEIRSFIDENPNLYDSHTRTINEFIAEQLGYKDWNTDGMKQPLQRLAGVSDAKAKDMDINELNRIVTEKMQRGELSDVQKKRFLELLQLEYKRKAMKQDFLNMSPEQLTLFRRDYENNKLLGDWEANEEVRLEGLRSKFREDMSSNETRKHNARWEEGYLSRPLSNEEKLKIPADLVEHKVFTDDAITNASPTLRRVITAIGDNVDKVSIARLNKTYSALSPKQQAWMLKETRDFVMSGKYKDGADVAKKAQAELQKRAQQDVKQAKETFQDVANQNARERAEQSFIATTARAEKVSLLKALEGLKGARRTIIGKTNQSKQELTDFYKSRVEEAEGRILDLETEYEAFQNVIGDTLDEQVTYHSGRIKRLEKMLASDDAIETYMRTKFDVDKILSVANADTGKLWLDNRASSERIANIVRTLREAFDQIGEDEISIGKLTQEQFDGLLGQYVPHILTPDGERHFAKLKELSDHGSKVSHDLGYGVTYNPHARSRTIKGKTIEEINEYFSYALKGANLFSESVADVYLSRAMSNLDLMYDDKYMRTMMNVFGKEIPADGVIEKGYKPVMNHGMMKKTTSDIASMRISMHISDDVTNYISHNFHNFRLMATASNMSLDKLIEAQTEEYLKQNYPKERIGELFKNFHERAVKDSRMNPRVLDGEAVPMVDVNHRQIKGIRDTYESTVKEFVTHNENRLLKTIQREGTDNEVINTKLGEMSQLDSQIRDGLISDDIYTSNRSRIAKEIMETLRAENIGSERVKNILKQASRVDDFTPPQIKQVNEAIVQKANQARKLQIQKDQSRFLQLYDKFLHFMKLNQTVVTPAFHMRNKVSNDYLNWLGVGRDAVDVDMQIATLALARNKGDLKEVLAGKKFGHKQLSSPLNIDNPHPELVKAVNMNNGQLHWDDLYNIALRYDVIDTGQFAADIGAGASTKGMFPNLRKERKDGTSINLDPTDTQNFAGYKVGTEVGTVVENQARILHFVALLKQGRSIEEASRSSKKFLFDYSDLTAFEQHVMKRIMPYYTWLRKNGRLQVSQLVENPEKFRFVAKVLTGIEHATPEEERMNREYIGDWAQGWVQLPWDVETREDKREKLLANPALPFMDLNRLPDPTNIDNTLSEFFSQTAPQIKVPIEQALNKNVFLDSKIVGEGDNQLVERVKHLMAQFGVYNTMQNVAKDNPADVGLGVVSSTTGAKATSVDYDTSRYMFSEEARDGESRTPIDDAIERYIKKLISRE